MKNRVYYSNVKRNNQVNAVKLIETDVPKTCFAAASEQEELRRDLCGNASNLTSFTDGTIGNRNEPGNIQKSVQGDIPKTKFAAASEQEELRRDLCGNASNLTSFSDGTIGNRNEQSNIQKPVQGDIPKTKFAFASEREEQLESLCKELLDSDFSLSRNFDGSVSDMCDASSDADKKVAEIPRIRVC